MSKENRCCRDVAAGHSALRCLKIASSMARLLFGGEKEREGRGLKNTRIPATTGCTPVLRTVLVVYSIALLLEAE